MENVARDLCREANALNTINRDKSRTRSTHTEAFPNLYNQMVQKQQLPDKLSNLQQEQSHHPG